LPPQWATTEAARREGQRPIKDYSHDSLRKNTELKAALTGSIVRQKAKRRKKLTLCSDLEIAEGDGVVVDEDVDE
jgi:hypothetical protein